MGSLSALSLFALGATALALLAGFLLAQPTGFARWLRKKNYQYEVTFSLYMMTPTEKFIFNSVLFLTLSMFGLACVLYLPNHLLTVSRRTYYYLYAADDGTNTAASLYGSATRAGDAVLDVASGWAHSAYYAALNKTASYYHTVAVPAADAGRVAMAESPPPL